MKNLRLTLGRPRPRALLAIPIVWLALACGEAQAPSQTADSASNVEHTQAESATGTQQQQSAGNGSGSGAVEQPQTAVEAAASQHCDPPNGGAICFADEDGRCDGIDATFTCENLCAAGEYALSCGAIGGRLASGGSVQEPPAACRSVAPTPGGIVFYCCPCE